jgi:2-phosphoglycerate kinase
MGEGYRNKLAHVLWIGGATDAGKTTVADMLAARYGLQTYHYDRADRLHIERLAQSLPDYRAALAESLDEKWVRPNAEELAERAMRVFRDRFPLVVEDLLALPQGCPVLAEGFGLTPELLAPVLSCPQQAIWLVPTEAFKWASMKRRGKPSFRDVTRDAARVTRNIFERDMLLAQAVKEQARARGLRVVEVDGAQTVEELAMTLEQHFQSLLPPRANQIAH